MNEKSQPVPPCSACWEVKVLDFECGMTFQPIVDLRDNSVFAYEALVRGCDGTGAAAILRKVNEQNRYGNSIRTEKLRQIERCQEHRDVAFLKPQFSPQIIILHFVAGQPLIHEMPLQMVSQVHFQTRPELNVACRLPCIDTTTCQHIS